MDSTQDSSPSSASSATSSPQRTSSLSIELKTVEISNRMRSFWRRFTYSVTLPQSTSNDTEVVEKEVFVCKLCVEANPENQKLWGQWKHDAHVSGTAIARHLKEKHSVTEATAKASSNDEKPKFTIEQGTMDREVFLRRILAAFLATSSCSPHSIDNVYFKIFCQELGWTSPGRTTMTAVMDAMADECMKAVVKCTCSFTLRTFCTFSSRE